MRRVVLATWRRLNGPQQAVAGALLAVVALLGIVEAASWAENSLSRPRYEVVWETELPASDRAYATVTKDGQYGVVLHTSPLKRAYKLSARGQIEWQLEFAPTKRFNPLSGIYNESLEIWGVIPAVGGGVMAHGNARRVFSSPPGLPNIENNAYVASIASDGALQWQKEIRPTGRQSASSLGFAQAVPVATGGLFFGDATGIPPRSNADDSKTATLRIAWWMQLAADGRVVAEHFDLEAERTGFNSGLRAPVWANDTLYALRGGQRTLDLTTRKMAPYGTDAFESIVAVDPASGAVKAQADLPYSCTRIVHISTGMVLSCYDQKLDPAVANVLAVWLDRDFKITANPMVWDRGNPRQGLAGRLVSEGTTLVHSAGSPRSTVGGQQVRVGLLNQSGEVVVWRRFHRLFWHSQVWGLIRGLEADTLLLVRTEYARYDLPLDGRTVVTLLRFLP